MLQELLGGRALEGAPKGLSVMLRWLGPSSGLTVLGSLVKHCDTKSLKAREKGPSSTGGFAFGIRKSTRMG